MKCNNCSMTIEKVFSFALKINQCPACGKHIMAPEKLAVYMSLQELIKSNFSDIDAEKVANLVVANFELKQLFKESVKTAFAPMPVRTEVETIEVSEDEVSDKELDEIHKAKQVEAARAQLKRMKKEAYEGALKDQYGMGEIEDEDVDVPSSDGFFSNENMDTAEIANRMQETQKQSTSQNEMLSGTGGFSRSDV